MDSSLFTTLYPKPHFTLTSDCKAKNNIPNTEFTLTSESSLLRIYQPLTLHHFRLTSYSGQNTTSRICDLPHFIINSSRFRPPSTVSRCRDTLFIIMVISKTLISGLITASNTRNLDTYLTSCSNHILSLFITLATSTEQ